MSYYRYYIDCQVSHKTETSARLGPERRYRYQHVGYNRIGTYEQPESPGVVMILIFAPKVLPKICISAAAIERISGKV